MSQSSIHILGIGNLGKLLAYSLRKCYPKTPITILFHRHSLVQEWDKAGNCIELTRDGVRDQQRPFRYEMVSQGQSEITNLIVATKSYATAQAIQPLAIRLGPASTVLFLQNGIGAIDDVTSTVFTKPLSRPKYIAGVVNHGVFSTSQFSCVHAGPANIILGSTLHPSNQTVTDAGTPMTTFLAQKIVDCSLLSATLVSPQGLLHAQLQKLAVNAVINPLTVIFNCLNGELFQRAAVVNLIRSLILEISTVTSVIVAADDQRMDENVVSKFSPANLEEVVFEVGARTAKNISSMRQDMLAGRKTEIDYINGYIMKRGTTLGLACPLNAKLVRLVKEGRQVNERDISDIFGIMASGNTRV